MSCNGSLYVRRVTYLASTSVETLPGTKDKILTPNSTYSLSIARVTCSSKFLEKNEKQYHITSAGECSMEVLHMAGSKNPDFSFLQVRAPLNTFPSIWVYMSMGFDLLGQVWQPFFLTACRG